MKIEKIKLTELNPAEYNPRQISNSELNKLSKNLEEFGLVDPIIIDLTDNNTIIGGHQRYKVLYDKHGLDDKLNLIKLGDVGWVFEDTKLKIKDKDHQKALNISLNKINGEWDLEKLTGLLDELNDNQFNMDLTGFEYDLSSINSNLFEETQNTSQPIFAENNESSQHETSEVDEENNITNEKTKEISLEFQEEFIIEIKLKSETELETTYQKLMEDGYNCRILTL